MKHVILKSAMSLILISLMIGCDENDIMDPGPEPEPGSEAVKISIIRDTDRTLDWSHTTGKIAFCLLGSDDYYDVALMNPDGSNVVCLTCDHPDLPKRHISNPTFDPSGKWIVMQVEKQEHFGSSSYSTPGIGFNSDIYTMNVGAGESTLKNLTNTPHDQWDEHAHYSPDGKRIVWIRSVNEFDPDDWRGTMKTEYFMMDANGENKKQVTFFNSPDCLLYTSPSPRDGLLSRMPSSA